MTYAPDNLKDLRLLREAPLPSGFEERLRERLLLAASEKRVVRLAPRKRSGAWLLLAAIVLPVAAFAAGGVFIAKQYIESTKATPAAVEAKPPIDSKAKSRPVPVREPAATVPSAPPTPTAETEPAAKPIESVASPRLHAPAKGDIAPASTSRTPSKRPNAESGNAGADKPQSGRTETIVPVPAERGPARIESLDVTLPRRGEAAGSDASKGSPAKSSELRNATQKGNGTSAAGEVDAQRRNQNREQSVERRGSDSGAQSRERNQERVRKGQ
jgi:hypothetical protein